MIDESIAGVDNSIDLKVAYLPFLVNLFSILEDFFPELWIGLFSPSLDFVLPVLPRNRVVKGSNAADALASGDDNMKSGYPTHVKASGGTPISFSISSINSIVFSNSHCPAMAPI